MTYTMLEIAWLFLVYAFIGWLWETPYVSIKEKKFVNRGFLRGPIIPIYGFAATTMMLSMSLIESLLVYEAVVNVIISMIYIASIASVWEYMTSFIMEYLFKTRWWDYSERKFNIKGRIALDVSIFWGFGGFILWRFVNTHVMALYHLIPALYMESFIVISYIVISIDTVTTAIELINLRKLVVKMQEASEELIATFVDKMDTLTDNLEGLSEVISHNLDEQKQNFVTKLNEAKTTFKGKMPYRRIEGFKTPSEFLENMMDVLKSKVQESETALTRFSESFSHLKSSSRFFQKYPQARTKQFERLYVTRNHLMNRKAAQNNQPTDVDKSHKDPADMK